MTLHAQVQDPRSSPSPIVLHVEGLTSEVRDALVSELRSDDSFHLRYACVPAGILVIEPTRDAPSPSTTRERLLAQLQRVPGHGRVSEDTRSLEELERICAAARN